MIIFNGPSALIGGAWGVGFTPSRSPQQPPLGARFTETANFVQLVVRHVFDADKGIVGACAARRSACTVRFG
jgi:hypothetical protein